MPALYNVSDPRDNAQRHMQGAINTYSHKMPEIEKPGHTAIGGMQNAAGGAMAGSAIGSTVGSALAAEGATAAEIAAAGAVGGGVGAIGFGLAAAALYYLS